MKLDRVTITGVDDGVDPADLVALSREFPFCEFGILLSKSRMGTPRYPSMAWLERLRKAATYGADGDLRFLPLSCHICGEWARDLLGGRFALPWMYDALPIIFDRCQINMTATEDTYAEPLARAMREWHDPFGPDEFIIQINGDTNAKFFDLLRDYGIGTYVVPLFDRSGGKGETPKEWPKAEYVYRGGNLLYHGYAGGLSPDNLPDELPKIAEAAGEAEVWIDMESGVRNEWENSLDLDKVRRALKICKGWVKV